MNLKPVVGKSRYKTMVLIAIMVFMILGVLGCLFVGGFFNTFMYRHDRAYKFWETRKPDHYRYVLSLKGDLVYQDYLVEVSNGYLVRLTDLNTGVSTGIPGSASTSFLPSNAWIRMSLLIDDLFIRIEGATHPPMSMAAFVNRANPGFYNRLTNIGWLPPGLITCDPPYPRVSYNPVYGYPEDLELAGLPCTYEAEYNTRMHVTIEQFQPLP